ncbi:MAG: hypothetical protein JNN00_10280 [Chitinophagaceae bacterium]|nr:hypothetical protein [Chitinophagaceae bacterium]
MRWLLFLSRLAFICGIFFLLSISLLIRNWTNDEAISSTIIIIGYFIGLIIVPLVNICYLAVLLVRRKLSAYVPVWLVTANIFFLVILILYIFYFNDPYYHQK